MPSDYYMKMTDEQARAELVRMGIALPKPKSSDEQGPEGSSKDRKHV